MRLGGLVLGACLLLGGAAGALAQEEMERAPHPRRVRRPPAAVLRPAPQSPQAAEDRAFLRQLADAQRALGEDIQQLRERVDSLHSDLASGRDRDDALEQEIKAARDEVKGLYVEISGAKQQIDALKDDIASVNSNVSGFRTYSGFFIAVMILLLAVIFVLTIRR